MGWAEGLLGGFTARKREVEQENLRLGEQTSARESKIFEALLNSPDEEVRSLATAGLLQSAGPMKKKGGLRGWLGEMESSPYLEKIRGLSATVTAPETAGVPGASSVVGMPPTAAAPMLGQITTPEGAHRGMPASEGSLAQAETAATQGEPLTPIEPTPRGPAVAPVASTVAPAGPGGSVLTGQAPAPRMVPRHVFQTQEEQTLARYSAQEKGEILGVVAAYEAVGVPHEEAVQRAIAERMRARGVGGAGAAGQSWAEGNTVPDPDSPTGFSQELYFRADPTKRMKIPAQPPTSDPTAAAAKTTAVTAARGAAAADVPLNTQQRFQATTDLSKEWNTFQTPVREMARQAQLMQTGLARYDADPIGGSQAVLVTFQKILDPTSVVRESEYARSPQGLSIMDRLEGMYERYKAGGAGVPKPVLAEMVKTANQFLEGMQGWNDQHRKRIYDTAVSYQIEPRLVLGADTPAGSPASTVATPPPAATAPARAIGAAPPGAAPKAPAGPAGLFVGADGELHRGSPTGPLWKPGG